MFKDWKTTLSGIGLWLMVGVAIIRLAVGEGDPQEVYMAIVAALAGTGLIASGDAGK